MGRQRRAVGGHLTSGKRQLRGIRHAGGRRPWERQRLRRRCVGKGGQIVGARGQHVSRAASAVDLLRGRRAALSSRRPAPRLASPGHGTGAEGPGRVRGKGAGKLGYGRQRSVSLAPCDVGRQSAAAAAVAGAPEGSARGTGAQIRGAAGAVGAAGAAGAAGGSRGNTRGPYLRSAGSAARARAARKGRGPPGRLQHPCGAGAGARGDARAKHVEYTAVAAEDIVALLKMAVFVLMMVVVH
ncbi:spidroin-1-like [Schistocerca nitens]|uniref:spidroin-1-like n=1 Tax=Schistocerca nitens TaxID=7011 RepID=UPI002118E2CF|nr:spidroin-1-like [Schistocerca nitens]